MRSAILYDCEVFATRENEAWTPFRFAFMGDNCLPFGAIKL